MTSPTKLNEWGFLLLASGSLARRLVVGLVGRLLATRERLAVSARSLRQQLTSFAEFARRGSSTELGANARTVGTMAFPSLVGLAI